MLKADVVICIQALERTDFWQRESSLEIMDPERWDLRRNQTCGKPGLLLQHDLFRAVSWFLTVTLEMQLFLELTLCPLNVILAIFCLSEVEVLQLSSVPLIPVVVL